MTTAQPATQTSHETAVGIGPTRMYRGQPLMLLPWDGEDVAAMRSRLRSVLPDPLLGLQEKLNPLNIEIQKVIALQAYEDHRNLGRLDTPAAREYWLTTDGLAFMLWLSIRKSLPQETFEQVKAWATEQKKDMRPLLEEVQHASGFGPDGEEPGGNSPSQPAKDPAPEEMPLPEIQLTGNTSTGSSPNVTHGRRRKRSRS